MNAYTLLKTIRGSGCDISLVGDKIKFSGPPLSQELKKLISENKNSLIEALKNGAELEAEKALVPPVCNVEQSESGNIPFKEYIYPDGTVLQLSKEDFDSVVDLFRVLHQQDLAIQKQKGKVS